MSDYTSADPATRLAAVRESINRVLHSQAYTLRERENRRASLADLRQMERELMTEVANNSAAGGFSLGQIDPAI